MTFSSQKIATRNSLDLFSYLICIHYPQPMGCTRIGSKLGLGPGLSLPLGFHLLGAEHPLDNLVARPGISQMTKLTSRLASVHQRP